MPNNEFNDIRVTYHFSSTEDPKHFEIFNELMGNGNATLIFGEFRGMEFKVDYTNKES